MASTGVLVGLGPTILSVVGSGLQDTALLACKRPLLALLIGIGRPSVLVLRTFEYGDVTHKLEGRRVKRGTTQTRLSPGPMLQNHSTSYSTPLVLQPL
jgi:hypothetical protein